VEGEEGALLGRRLGRSLLSMCWWFQEACSSSCWETDRGAGSGDGGWKVRRKCVGSDFFLARVSRSTRICQSPTCTYVECNHCVD
jgi:hypothetical protein